LDESSKTDQIVLETVGDGPAYPPRASEGLARINGFEGGNALRFAQLFCGCQTLALRQHTAPATIERIVANDIQLRVSVESRRRDVQAQ